MNSLKERILGIAYEEAFWRSQFGVKRARKGLYAWSRYGREIMLKNFDIVSFLDEWEQTRGSRPKVLDVGAGASFCTGNLAHGKEIDLHCIDPLAAYYNKVIRKTRPQHFPLVEFGAIEQLSAFYPKGDVAFIHVQNALDHSRQPVQGIVECMRCLAQGGILYLKHFPNEAERENYRGFHQYNIDTENGELTIWNKSERHNINRMLDGFSKIEVTTSDIGEVIAVITKTGDVPTSLYDDSKNLREVCELQAQTAEVFNSFGFAMKYHTKRRFYIIVQHMMRWVSPQFKAKLKKWMKKKTGK